MNGIGDLAMARRERDEAATKNPPAVGLDERRMQVRAYNAWSALLGTRQWPSIAELDLDTLDFADRSILLDFTAGVDNPAIVHMGQLLRAESGLQNHIHRLDDLPRGSLASRLTDHYLQIFANHAPIGFEAEYANGQGQDILYRGILLPFSSDDETIDFLLGVINWKQVETEQPDQSLIAAKGQAMASPLPSPMMGHALSLVSDLSEDAPIESASLAMGAPVPNPVSPIWADGPSGGEGKASASASAVGASPPEMGGLQSRLADARIFADQARDSDGRSRAALYRAIGKAWDFALAAGDQPDVLVDLLQGAGLKAQRRAPMTPIVKLVFGADHDKSRLAEYAAVLNHAQAHSLGAGALDGYIASYEGGLKNLVKDIRAERRAARSALAPATDRLEASADQLRAAAPAATIAHDGAAMGDQEFILLIGRVTGDGHVAVVGQTQDDPILLGKAMKKAVPLV